MLTDVAACCSTLVAMGPGVTKSLFIPIQTQGLQKVPYPFVKNYKLALKPTEMTDIISLNTCRNL